MSIEDIRRAVRYVDFFKAGEISEIKCWHVKSILLAAEREILFLRSLQERLPENHQPVKILENKARRLLYLTKGKKQSSEDFKKKSRCRLQWVGASAEETFWLELLCLLKLEEVSNKEKLQKTHFPRVTSVNEKDKSFTMESVGLTVDKLYRMGRKVDIPDASSQIDRIVDLLVQADIKHLDVVEKDVGKNIAISDDGIISLIDFDVSCIDNILVSGAIKERHELYSYEDLRYALKSGVELVKG